MVWLQLWCQTVLYRWGSCQIQLMAIKCTAVTVYSMVDTPRETYLDEQKLMICDEASFTAIMVVNTVYIWKNYFLSTRSNIDKFLSKYIMEISLIIMTLKLYHDILIQM